VRNLGSEHDAAAFGIERAITDAESAVSPDQVASKVFFTPAHVAEELARLSGAITIVWPQGLPPSEPVRRVLEGGDVQGEHDDRTCQLWWARKSLQRGKTVADYLGRNARVTAVAKLTDHPIRLLFDRGVLTCPCTDNPTVSGVTLSGEFMLLHETFGFSVAEIMKLIDYGFRAAFVPESLRRGLRVEAFVRAIAVLEAAKVPITGLDELYYTRLGVTVPPRFMPPVRNPPLTLALLQQVPKCDIDCRFFGSVPTTLLFDFYTHLGEAERAELPAFRDSAEVFVFLHNESDRQARKEARRFCLAVLQTEQNIRDGVRAIVREAFEDKVMYMELTLCPLLHTQGGLAGGQVIDAVLDEIAKFTGDREMEVNVVLSADIGIMSPLEVQAVAEQCVAYRGRGVVGFATTSSEIDVASMRFYEQTFEYLRTNFIRVTMFAGDKTAASVSCALVRGHARRISGAFRVAQSETLLNDVTLNNISVMASLSRRMKTAVCGWTKSPVRFLFDFCVRVAFCSIHHTFSGMTRSQQLFELAESSGFDAVSVMTIIDNTFRSAFLPYKRANAYQKVFWERAVEILRANGFTRTMNYAYFVPPKLTE